MKENSKTKLGFIYMFEIISSTMHALKHSFDSYNLWQGNPTELIAPLRGP